MQIYTPLGVLDLRLAILDSPSKKALAKFKTLPKLHLQHYCKYPTFASSHYYEY